MILFINTDLTSGIVKDGNADAKACTSRIIGWLRTPNVTTNDVAPAQAEVDLNRDLLVRHKAGVVAHVVDTRCSRDELIILRLIVDAHLASSILHFRSNHVLLNVVSISS